MFEKIKAELALPEGNLGTLARAKRIDAILEAQTWPSGTDRENQRFTTHYVSGDFSIELGKPGKEVSRDINPNEHDMTPTVFFKGIALSFKPTFQQLWKDLELAIPTSSPKDRAETLQILCALLFRGAFLLDHALIDFVSSDGIARQRLDWEIPTNTLAHLLTSIPTLGEPVALTGSEDVVTLPTDVYLQLIDAIALNEDVKYQSKTLSLGGNPTPIGRVNTLLTTCYVMAGLLGLVHFMDVVVKMMTSRGVAPISQKDAKRFFYYLSSNPAIPDDPTLF